MTLVDALSVARAALMEVGGDPRDVWIEGGWLRGFMDDSLVVRAGYLGLMAQCGGDHSVCCESCAVAAMPLPPCTPVRDVLRGVTRGGGS